MKQEKKFHEEILEWQLERIRLREKYADTPAGFSDPEQATLAMQQWKEDMDRFLGNKRRNVLSVYHPSEEFFAGREEQLQEIASILGQGNGPVVLYGVGGIGKSALARAFARRYEHLYDHVLFFHFSGSIQDMINNDFELNISNLHYNDALYNGRRQYFREKYKIFRQIAEQSRLLVIVDNCNVKKDKDMPKLFALPCDVIVTSRINPELWKKTGCPCTGMCVEPLRTDEEWHSFIEGYQKKKVTPDEFAAWMDYCKKIQGHTLLMQLKICNPKLDMELAKEFKADLFEQFSLKKGEKTALTYLSFMPVQGIPQKLFYRITDCTEAAIRHLTEYMLVYRRRDEQWQDDMLCMHPVIAEAAREIFQPNCQNCARFISGLADYLSDKTGDGCTWMRTYEENHGLEPYVFAMTRTFDQPAPWLAEAFDELVTFLWIQCYFKEAEQYSLKLYDAVKAFYGELHQTTGYMACRTSAVYYNCMDFENALRWAEKGYQIIRDCEPSDSNYNAYLTGACERLAKLYRYSGRVDDALQMVEQILHYLDNCKTERTLGYYYAVLLKSKILFQMGKVDQAADLFEQKLIREQDTTADAWEAFRNNEFQSFYVTLLVKKAEFEKAYQISEKLVKNAVLYRGEQFKDSLSCMEQLGDICTSLNKKSEACNWYGMVVERIEENYPYQIEWKGRILDKMVKVL
jgi:tetratricopeptide (TPR) repeat protein